MTTLADALALRDLTDPAAGPHAVQLVVDRLETALTGAWRVPVRRDPGPRVVPVRDNYDRLRYPPDAVTRDRRYTRYLGDGRMLRSHTTARIPTLLEQLAADGPDLAAGDPALAAGGPDLAAGGPALAAAGGLDEVLLSVPGICYRRDAIDRQHVGTPHQIDLWRVRLAGPPLGEEDLVEMIGLAVASVLPEAGWRTVAGPHPYTLAGREIYAAGVEVGECGLAHPQVLATSGLPETASGLAMGLGLDRLTMLAKGITDIRLLRATDPRVAGQMADLLPYRPVSSMPATRRDLSLAVDCAMDAELLGDRVREVLGPDAEPVEEVLVLAETPGAELPDSARLRMGLRPGQKNVLVRLVLRHPTRTLSTREANTLRDRAYAGLHDGSEHEWTLA
jgi:phenylalanyl-tRNA synthetase alpha chain